MDNKTSLSSERVYALDALRAIMMLLGIVLHAAITYGVVDYQTAWPLKDPNNNLIFDLIVGFIHAFRMPVFFVAAGYFGALLFYKKGPEAMLANRFKRILLPFLAGVLIIFPLVVFAFTFSQSAFTGAATPITNASEIILSGKFLPFNVIHLWFLYFLIMYAITACLLAILFKQKTVFTASANKMFTYIVQNIWLRLLILAALIFLCLQWMGTPFILTNNKWSVEPSIFITYFILFGAGWIIFKTKSLAKLKDYPVWQLSFATVLFLVSSFMPGLNSTWELPIKMLLTAVYISLFIYGFIAFFLTYFSNYSPLLTYLMDASYYVYIIHLPIVAFLPGLMAGFSLPVFVKFLITLSATSIICMASYKYLVRGSFIEIFLNGKAHKRKSVVPANEMLLQS